MSGEWLSEKRIEHRLKGISDSQKLAEHYWLSRFYQQAVFSKNYAAPDSILDLIVFSDLGQSLRDSCVESLKIRPADAALALYGIFYHTDLLVDHLHTDVTGVHSLLNDDILKDRIRLPFIWGRTLHDAFNDAKPSDNLSRLTNLEVWSLLNNLPVGVFQHGTFLSGPLGIITSTENRWIPLQPMIIDCYVREGTRKKPSPIPFEPARIDVVSAYEWIFNKLLSENGPPSEWQSSLTWFGNPQTKKPRSDYIDICPLVADCILYKERTSLLEQVLKTDAAKFVREVLKTAHSTKGLRSLPPKDLAEALSPEQQLQLLLVVPTTTIIQALDQLVLTGGITIPPSEIRLPKKSVPRFYTAFASELSSLGVRPGHTHPFVMLSASILKAYTETDGLSELAWRLQCDTSRSLQESLADYIRREGPHETVDKLVLTSQPVTHEVCNDIQVPVAEMSPRTSETVRRMLWKFGFEIARYDETLPRLHRWLQQFEDSLSQIDFTHGELARERVRAEGVNLFVAVEKFLDQLISFNVWLVTSDHWGSTQFQYKLSDSRRAVPEALGEQLEAVEGSVSWKVNGENALGTQLSYLNEFEVWLDGLQDRPRVPRTGVDFNISLDAANRPFPFRHLHLWADADAIELQRYREMLKKTIRTLAQADIPGVRNGLDHQRDDSRFPTEESLWTCVTRLKAAVRTAEQSRLYPVQYWFESQVTKVFGTDEITFKSSRGDTLKIFKPSTVDGMPAVTKIHPVVFAPVNFLGAADSMLFFKVMGESEYSKHWVAYPRIFEIAVRPDETCELPERCSPVDASIIATEPVIAAGDA